MPDDPVAESGKSGTEIPQLTDAFRKARRQLMIWSAALLVWILLGVDPTKLDGTPGSVTKAVNTEAIPIALTVVVFYCWYRWAFEWISCDPRRCNLMPSRIDATITLAFAGLAGFTGWLYLLGGNLLGPFRIHLGFVLPLTGFPVLMGIQSGYWTHSSSCVFRTIVNT